MLPDSQVFLRLLAAAVLGGLIGLERERLNWAAGLRTHMLVCVGAALFMIVSSFGFEDVLRTHQVSLDPSRVAAQVVSGIGFLGAGNIVLRREVVRGLTTAASLWTVAAVGLAVGGGLFVAAVTATVIILGILAGLKPLENRIQTAVRRPATVSIIAKRGIASIESIEGLAEGDRLSISEITVRHKSGDESEVQFLLRKASSASMAAFAERLQHEPGIRKVRVTAENGTLRRRKVRLKSLEAEAVDDADLGE